MLLLIIFIGPLFLHMIPLHPCSDNYWFSDFVLVRFSFSFSSQCSTKLSSLEKIAWCCCGTSKICFWSLVVVHVTLGILGAGYSWSNVINTFSGVDRGSWWCGGGGARPSLVSTSLGGCDWLLCWCLCLIFSFFPCNDFWQVSLISYASFTVVVVVAVGATAFSLRECSNVSSRRVVPFCSPWPWPWPWPWGLRRTFVPSFLFLQHQQELYHEWCLLYVSAVPPKAVEPRRMVHFPVSITGIAHPSLQRIVSCFSVSVNSYR